MQNIIYKTVIVLTILITGVIGPSISSAEESDRPTNLTLESFQFGPVNRWTFSHMREIIPTVNIPRDTNRFLVLNNSDDLVADFSVEFQGRKQSIDEIAVHQFIDGLLIIKDGEIVGAMDGANEGVNVGTKLGANDGTSDGEFVGAKEGAFDGISDGASVGLRVGTSEGEL
jgi:hypothetical protein